MTDTDGMLDMKDIVKEVVDKLINGCGEEADGEMWKERILKAQAIVEEADSSVIPDEDAEVMASVGSLLMGVMDSVGNPITIMMERDNIKTTLAICLKAAYFIGRQGGKTS